MEPLGSPSTRLKQRAKSAKSEKEARMFGGGLGESGDWSRRGLSESQFLSRNLGEAVVVVYFLNSLGIFWPVRISGRNRSASRGERSGRD